MKNTTEEKEIQKQVDVMINELRENFNSQLHKNILELYLDNTIENAVIQNKIQYYDSYTISCMVDVLLSDNSLQEEIDSIIINRVNNLRNALNPIIFKK